MSFFLFALGRLSAIATALCLLALSLGATSLSLGHIADRAAARAEPPPALRALGDLPPGTKPLAEVNLRAAITAAIDVKLPLGLGRLYLLSDPATPQRRAAAVLVEASDLPAFEGLVNASSLGTAKGGVPVIALAGTLAAPLWIDRAVQAAADSGHAIDPDIPFIRPFYAGREDGLAPSLFAYVVPVVMIALFLGFLASELARGLQSRHARLALRGMAQLDAQLEAMTTASEGTQDGPHWSTLATRRADLRQRRALLERRLRNGGGSGGKLWFWVVVVAALGATGLVPHRPLAEFLSCWLLGGGIPDILATPALRDISATFTQLGDLPGEMLAQAVLAALGPQSIGVAGSIRTLPGTFWVAVLGVFALVLQRRAEIRRSERGSLR